MTEVWQYSIPATIALAGLFHLFLAELFTSIKEEKPLVISWLGFAYILILDAVFAAHQLALNTTSADLSPATRVAYILVLVSFGWSLVYLIYVGFQFHAKNLIETGKRWIK